MVTSITELFNKDLHRPSQTQSAVRDIYLAAFLHSLEYKLEYAKSDGYQAEFSFAEVPSGILLAYYNDSFVEKLTARKLFSSFQDMRRVSRQIRIITSAPTINDIQELQQEQ